MISRISRNLGMLISSGISIVDALTISEETMINSFLIETMKTIKLSIIRGKEIAETFQNANIFPSMVVQMVAVGEKTGNLDQIFIEIADYYEKETERVIKNLVTILEPVMLLIIGIFIIFIALSVLSPIFNMIKVFKH
ncbi:MAG: type II secretion system F family protein [bacterium]